MGLTMKLRAATSALLLASSVLFPLATVAEEIRVPVGSQSSAVDMPKRGASKANVEAEFGTPSSTSGPTGEPPIYYWEYPGFTVYFESDHVLHTVSKKLSGSN